MITNAIASVAVADVRRTTEWYTRLFGRKPDSSALPEIAEWNFERGGALQVYELKERAGHGSVTLAVSSLEDQMAALEGLGIDPGHAVANAKARAVMIKDPDGNSIAFAETIQE